MGAFIDVTPYHWAFNEIEELYERTYRGAHFVAGIAYNAFEPGKAPVDLEVVCINNGQSEFVLNTTITPAQNNPLAIFVEGGKVNYVEIRPNDPVAGQTFVKLSRGVKAGSRIRFYTPGVPSMIPNDPLNRPTGLISVGVKPSGFVPVGGGYGYLFEKLSTNSAETAYCNGRQLRRVDTKDAILTEDDYFVEEELTGVFIHTDYKLNNEQINFNFLVQDAYGNASRRSAVTRVTSPSMIYKDRFFPDTLITRAEMVVFLNRMRNAMFEKFADTPAPSSIQIYSRFPDVPTNAWYLRDLIDMEEIQVDAHYLIAGDEQGNFNPESPLTRAEMVVFLDRFRRWLIDTFK